MKIWNTKNGYTVTCLLEGRSNVFIVSCKRGIIMVDTGTRILWKILKRRLDRMSIKNIDYLVLTHSHYDHAGNAAKIKRYSGAKVMVHETEADFLGKGENTIIKGTNRFAAFFVNLLTTTPLSRLKYEQCKPDMLTGNSFNMADYGFDVIVIHTPGHSPGSQSVIVDNEIALVGDTMFGVFRRSVFPPFALDTKEMMRSWEKLLMTGCRLFLPSHGNSRTREIVEKNLLRFKKKS